jgi:hypothetical protein
VTSGTLVAIVFPCVLSDHTLGEKNRVNTSKSETQLLISAPPTEVTAQCPKLFLD